MLTPISIKDADSCKLIVGYSLIAIVDEYTVLIFSPDQDQWISFEDLCYTCIFPSVKKIWTHVGINNPKLDEEFTKYDFFSREGIQLKHKYSATRVHFEVLPLEFPSINTRDLLPISGNREVEGIYYGRSIKR